MIRYDVFASQPQRHQFTVRLVISHPSPEGQKVSLPTWIPGSYFIRDFARHIITLQAYAGEDSKGQQVLAMKENSYTWQIAQVTGPLCIEYTVYAYDTSVRGAYIDEEQAFFNPCSMLLMVNGQEASACEVNLIAPQVAKANAWRVATTLTAVDAKPWGFGTYQAANYDELIDKPVQMGTFELIEFQALGIAHAIAVTGDHQGDLQRLAHDVQKMCEAHLQLFGAPYPFNRYLFLLNLRKDGYGGLEHRDSTALQIQKDYMPERGESVISPYYITLLGLFSHEYFHAWNIKRIKPENFMPYNLTDKSYTKQLWAFEGITSYYDDLALIRAKVISLQQYFDLVSQTLTKLLRNPGRKKQTVLDASFDAWIKFYQPNENSGNAQVSYYVKGAIIALAIDLALRAQTEGRASLDDVMRQLWREFGQTGLGVPEGKIEALIIEAGGPALQALLAQALYTTEDIDLEKLLAPFGLSLTLRQSEGSDDAGGKRLLPFTKGKSGYAGFTMTKSQGKLLVSQVIAQSCAELAGICVNDEVLAIDHNKVDAESYERTFKKYRPGQKVTFHLFRQDKLKTVEVTLAELPFDTVEIAQMQLLSAAQISALSSWLATNIS